MRSDPAADAVDPAEVVAPLTLEQGLYLLDKLTWFPETGPDRLERITAYVAERSPAGTEVDAEDVRRVLDRVHGGPGAPDPEATGRWRSIPDAKRLYALKYDVKQALLPDRFFSFMNMGWIGADLPDDLGSWLEPEEQVWTASANLYERVAGDVVAGRDVLEVGCGRGGGARYLARRHTPRRFDAVDQSSANIGFARDGEPSGVRFVVGDAEDLDVADASVDVVVNIESAHCYPHPDRFLREVHRVLRPGGELRLADEWWTSADASLADLVRDAGFTVVADDDLTAGIVAALHRLRTPLRTLIAAQDPARRPVFERFFGERVLVESRHSYESGRFDFRLVTARKEPS